MLCKAHIIVVPSAKQIEITVTKDPHYTSLENVYLAARLNEFYLPTIDISEAHAELTIDLSEKFFHSAGAVHGSVYFKMLDDAAFFAANSLERDVFVLTTSFTTYITRPISAGQMKAVGRVVNQNRTQFIAEAVAYNDDGREIARGNGLFVRSKIQLADLDGYHV